MFRIPKNFYSFTFENERSNNRTDIRIDNLAI